MAEQEPPSRRFTRNIRRAVLRLFVVVATVLLTSCEEYAPLLMTPPGLVVAAPIAGAMILAEGPEIRQPVLVRSASGEPLTPPFDGPSSARFTVKESTVICTGTHNLNQPSVVTDDKVEGGYSTYYKFPLTCNKDLKGRAFVSIRPPYEKNPSIHLTVGPKRVPLTRLQSRREHILGETTYTCFNDYSWQSNPVKPFRVKCFENSGGQRGDLFGAVAQNAANQGRNKFTVWLFPKD